MKREKQSSVTEEELRKNMRVNLRQLRENAGLTQEEVAGVLHISRSAYSYYELGGTSPSVTTLRLLCQFYGIDEKKLFLAGAAPNLHPGRKRVRRKKP